jgi:hypothetical protein
MMRICKIGEPPMLNSGEQGDKVYAKNVPTSRILWIPTSELFCKVIEGYKCL